MAGGTASAGSAPYDMGRANGWRCQAAGVTRSGPDRTELPPRDAGHRAPTSPWLP